ncbi:polysaccharide export protein [Parapedobacter sp. SGR-10]|uniref:polysaccharide biosynthesis/export family protein n=1 Tax=Parapedobacter sp. SGR-10 TaxID=2710879 RepID=UPI0013D46FE4|nr:polysaccharide biosynthesis/export family protein [Parapedobacter sp. SGR-10]NGF56516.1 polysaccharide export protein [Parapedobacter sp. SGR-10]
MRNYLLPICVAFVSALLLVSSCASRKDVIYFQQNQSVLDSAFSVDYVRIKPMDRLRINVSGPDEAAIAPFRVNTTQGGGGGATNQILYTVDHGGNVVLPYLGAVHVAGKTRLQTVESIREALKRYVNDPIIDVQIENFRVTILGDIGAQVIDLSDNDRPTILDAIAMSGDLKITARRNDILVIREEGAQRRSYRLDIRDAGILNSPAYYLTQNDIIYVEPNTTGIQGNRRPWYLSLGMTVIGAGLTIYNLFNLK